MHPCWQESLRAASGASASLMTDIQARLASTSTRVTVTHNLLHVKRPVLTIHTVHLALFSSLKITFLFLSSLEWPLYLR